MPKEEPARCRRCRSLRKRLFNRRKRADVLAALLVELLARPGHWQQPLGGAAQLRRLGEQRRNVSDSSRLRQGPPGSSPSSAKIACALRAQLVPRATRQRTARAAPGSGRASRRSAGRRAAARSCRSSCSPGAGRRRRSCPTRRKRSSCAPRPNAIALPAGRPRSRTRKRRCFPSPTVGQLAELAAGDEQRDAGIAEAERREPPQLRAEPERQRAAGHDRVDDRQRPEIVVGQVLVGVRGERVGEARRPPRGGSRGRPRRDGRRSARGAASRRRARRAGRRPGSSGRSPSSRRRCRRSGRRAGGSARRGARRRSRSRPRASSRPRRRSRAARRRASGQASISALASRRMRSSTAWRSRFSSSSSRGDARGLVLVRRSAGARARPSGGRDGRRR